jgi:hypothetical protein
MIFRAVPLLLSCLSLTLPAYESLQILAAGLRSDCMVGAIARAVPVYLGAGSQFAISH